MTFRRLRRLVLTISLFAFGAPACDAGSVTGVCTNAGCSSGLTVLLNAMPEGAFTVELFDNVQPNVFPTYRYECVPGAIPCLGIILFKDFTGTQTNVRVTTAAGTATYAVNVTYATLRPNGPRCGPVCRTASTTVNIPAS